MANDDRGSNIPLGSARSSAAVRWGVSVAAVAYIAYLALLITCDLLRVAPLGFVPRFDRGAVLVEHVDADSIAARHDLRPGDRITRANGQLLEAPADWQRVRVHLDPTKPLDLEIDRAQLSLGVSLVLPSGLQEWRNGPPRVGLLAFRLFQAITLVFAVGVAVKRTFHPPALIGALLLASIATVSLVLPMRMVAFWNALPGPFGTLLWIPFATSVAIGPLLFAFFAVFPRQVLSTPKLAAALVPAAFIVTWDVIAWYQITRDLGPPTGIPDLMPVVALANVVYAGFAVLLLLAHERAAETLTDRRRIRVLSVGAVVGITAGIGVVSGYWQNPGADIFATSTLTVLSLVFLAVPASFAYAILRHRLFDVGLIVRQGLQYALARRFVDALIPVLGAVLLVDVIVHRAQPLGTMLQSRWWWFTLVGAALLVVRSRREQWLRTVDRRFFRDRYDAQRLLRSIADQITRASSFEAIVPSVMQQIDEALHPEFVSVLRHVPADSTFCAVSTVSIRDQPWSTLPASLAVIGVLSVLRKPLALSLGDTAWVRHQLPLDERALLLEHGIELLVPISGELSGEPPLALLALGPRRSEEPYSQEDLDLLVTIAHAVGALLERTALDRHALAECERCGRCFEAGADRCPDDGQPLIVSPGSRILNGRYRLERRRGRGGMGAVYEAVDDVLERTVAVKLIRHDVEAPLNLAVRFRQEARAAAGFAHPHVVRIYDFGIDRDRRPFLVMELLEGETLRQRLAGGLILTPPEALHILRGVCSALSAAHGQGIVHRDLKPENIFLLRHASGVVPKVLDFGLAKTFDVRPSFQRSTGAGTSAGLLVGTLEYMAPEQVAGDDVNPAWDLWALGVITYEMLTGRHPFRRNVVFADAATIADGVACRADQAPALSDAMAAFFRSALSTERALRPREPLEFLAACEQALS
ncbi:MAG TPA: protein kinase [Vicinamibacterales bacterium]|nr:protein kinase [Vicinamibacterales bacterium]